MGRSHGVPQLYPLPFPCRPKEGSKENTGPRSKRALEEEEEGSTDILSKNKQKKQLRNPHKTFDPSLKRKLLQLPPQDGRRGWGAREHLPGSGRCSHGQSL